MLLIRGSLIPSWTTVDVVTCIIGTRRRNKLVTMVVGNSLNPTVTNTEHRALP